MIGDIRQHLGVAPFEPFTIVTTGGAQYPVPTADHVGLNPRGSRVVVWFDDDSSVTISGNKLAIGPWHELRNSSPAAFLEAITRG